MLGWIKAHKVVTGVVVLAALTILAGATGDGSREQETKNNKTEQSTNQTEAIFDMPALVGKNIDEVRSTLGAPKDSAPEPSQQQVQAGEWSNSFIRNREELLVTFDPATRKVIDFFISTDDPSGQTKDKEALKLKGNLREGDARYRLEYVGTIRDKSLYTGIKVIPR